MSAEGHQEDEGFVRLHYWWQDAEWMTPSLLAVLAAISRLGWRDGCYAERETIAQLAHVDAATVKRALPVLVANGAIVVSRRPGRSSIIHVNQRPMRRVTSRPRELSELLDTPELLARGSGHSDPGHGDPGQNAPGVGALSTPPRGTVPREVDVDIDKSGVGAQSPDPRPLQELLEEQAAAGSEWAQRELQRRGTGEAAAG